MMNFTNHRSLGFQDDFSGSADFDQDNWETTDEELDFDLDHSWDTDEADLEEDDDFDEEIEDANDIF